MAPPGSEWHYLWTWEVATRTLVSLARLLGGVTVTPPTYSLAGQAGTARRVLYSRALWSVVSFGEAGSVLETIGPRVNQNNSQKYKLSFTYFFCCCCCFIFDCKLTFSSCFFYFSLPCIIFFVSFSISLFVMLLCPILPCLLFFKKICIVSALL